MRHVQTGERRRLTDRLIDSDGTREAEYGRQCATWALHQP